MYELNEADLKIVRFALDHPRASYAELSRGTEIAETTVRRRFEALVQNGVLTPAMIPDIERLGFGSRAVVGVKVDLNYLNETAERIQAMPEITSLYMTMGRYDLIFVVAEPTLDDLRGFLVENIAPLPGIREMETFVSTRTLKMLRDWRIPSDIELGFPTRRIRTGQPVVSEDSE